MPRGDLLEELQEVQRWIEPKLEGFISANTPEPELTSRCLYAVSQMGLRERSWLVATVAGALGSEPARFTPLAVAAECFIAAALTSDDILDGADERWGKPSCLARWGHRDAMLIAEQLHGLAHLSLDGQHEGSEPGDSAPAIREFREHFAEFFAWQFADISREGDPATDLEHILELAYRRTGRLLHACAIGPALALQADGGTVSALSRYGRAVGTLLQLRDDVLDFLGERSRLGKPILGDLSNGQPNLVLHFALQGPPSPPRDLLLSLFASRRRLSSAEEGSALEAIRRTEAVDAAFEVLLREASTGKAAVHQLPETDDRGSLLLFLGALIDLPVQLR